MFMWGGVLAVGVPPFCTGAFVNSFLLDPGLTPIAGMIVFSWALGTDDGDGFSTCDVSASIVHSCAGCVTMDVARTGCARIEELPVSDFH